MKSTLQREEGMALVFALVAMTAMSILLVSLVTYTSATARDSYLKRSDDNSYALAEAALNQGLAQLASHYYSGATANNSTTAFSKDWIAGGTTSQQSPGSPVACTAGSTCMSWSLVSCSFYATISGCSSPGGSAGIKQGTIVLKGTGTVPNPTGGAALTNSVTAKIDVSQPAQLVQTPSYWTEIYSGAPPSSGCDVTFGQGVAISAPVYIAGNLCLTQTAQITGSSTNLKVGGWLSLKNQSYIGTSAGPIGSAQVGGACPNGASSSGCTINKNGGSIWDNTPSTQHAATAPTPDPLPAVNWSWMQAAQANSTPAASCTGGKSFSDANFDLAPNFSYSCTSSLGSITYTAGNPGTLAVSGDLYFPNNLTIGSASVKYSGVASIFVGGTLTTANNAVVCVAIASGDCDFANATVSSSPNYWDTTSKVLLIQTMGAITATNLHFQGGLYSQTSINLGGGQSETQGPLVTPGSITVGQQLAGSFPSFPLVQAGSLGTPPPPYTLGKPYGGSF